MQKDLENLANEMKKLEPGERNNWLYKIACSREVEDHVSGSYWQRQEVALSYKCTLIWALSGVLTNGKEESAVIKKGVDAFLMATKEAREEFYAMVRGDKIRKVTTKSSLCARDESRTRE